MAQDSTGTRKRRGPGRPFPKGVSGNPGGRPAGFTALVRNATKDGQELVEFAVKVFRGETFGRVKIGKRWVTIRPGLDMRMDAMRWLADRGFGKPPQPLEGGDPDRPLVIDLVWEDAGINGSPK